MKFEHRKNRGSVNKLDFFNYDYTHVAYNSNLLRKHKNGNFVT